MIKILILLLLAANSYASHHVSVTEKRGTISADAESEFNLRIFKKISKSVKLMGELKSINQEDNNMKRFMLGAYYRLFKNWKLGLFYSRESGLLHDDDWEKVQEGSGTYWGWKHTEDRIEQIYITDLTFRKEVLKRLVFEIKNRFNYNSFNHHQFLRFRPGLTYFFSKDLVPLLNIFLQHETYHPLSGYSKESIYEKWIYLGGLYHMNSTVKLGAFGAKKEVNWESGTVKSDVYGLNLILNY